MDGFAFNSEADRQLFCYLKSRHDIAVQALIAALTADTEAGRAAALTNELKHYVERSAERRFLSDDFFAWVALRAVGSLDYKRTAEAFVRGVNPETCVASGD